MQIQQAVSIAKSLIAIPENYEPVFAKQVTHDGKNIIWMRFKKHAQLCELGGEHFSLTFDAENKILKGFIHLEDNFETEVIPNEEDAEKIAFQFLKVHAPDLVDTVEVRWIRPLRKNSISPPHDEGFALNSGKVITGMRVKLLIHSNNKYGWVISGKNGHVITFERDITWDTVNKCRATERWLHDNWVQNRSEINQTATAI